MRKQYRVLLTEVERERLVEQVHHGRGAARDLTHARILLKADEGSGSPAWKDDQIVESLEVSRATVERVRKRFSTEGLAAAVVRRPLRAHRSQKIDGTREAQLIALACSEPPTGRAEWSLRLLAGRMVALYDDLEGVSYETIRRTLKKTNSSRG